MSLAIPLAVTSALPKRYHLTQPYHTGPVSYNPNPHLALDMVGQYNQPILAAESGKVAQASWNAGGWAIGGGWCVIIDHIGPGGRRSRSTYAHLARMAVSPGQWVVRGQVIGYSDSTGNSSGHHLHFAFGELYSGSYRYLDPYRYFRAHSYQNGYRGNGDLVNSAHTRCTIIVGVYANGTRRPANLRSGPYLTSPIVRTASGRNVTIFQGLVNGSTWNGTRLWDKLYDPATRRIVYLHASLGLWVV